MNWIDAIAKLSRDNAGFVLVTVLETAGSAPRGRDAKMAVDAARSYDTIGGGNLEFEAIKLARELLAQDAPAVCSRDFSLGADLTQCCGGKVRLLLAPGMWAGRLLPSSRNCRAGCAGLIRARTCSRGS